MNEWCNYSWRHSLLQQKGNLFYLFCQCKKNWEVLKSIKFFIYNIVLSTDIMLDFISLIYWKIYLSPKVYFFQ